MLGSCKKGALVQNFYYEQHQDGPDSCHAIANSNVFAHDHLDGPAACRKDGWPGQFFLFSDHICKIF